MPQTASEMAAILSVILRTDGDRATDSQEITDQDCEQMLNDAFATRSYQSTQCFACSRIYFDRVLQKCPRCKSESLHHYTTADLVHFVRDPTREPF